MLLAIHSDRHETIILTIKYVLLIIKRNVSDSKKETSSVIKNQFGVKERSSSVYYPTTMPPFLHFMYYMDCKKRFPSPFNPRIHLRYALFKNSSDLKLRNNIFKVSQPLTFSIIYKKNSCRERVRTRMFDNERYQG